MERDDDLLHVPDPESPLGLTLGQKLQSELAEHAASKAAEVPVQSRTVRALLNRRRIVA